MSEAYRNSYEEMADEQIVCYPLYAAHMQSTPIATKEFGTEATPAPTFKRPSSTGAAPKASKKSTTKVKREMDIDSDFNFGKHNGKPMREVLEKFPDYISWMIDNDVAIFDEELMDYIVDNNII